MSTFSPDPKPDARLVADRNEWATIVLAKAGPCRSCGAAAPIEMHHLVNRSQRGDDVAGNLIPLCPDCHRSITSRLAGWEIVASAIRCGLSPLEVGYCSAKKGRAWLERMYPAGDSTLCARCKQPVRSREPREAPRKRKRWQMAVPADAEDGADVIDSLIEAARGRLGPVLGYDEGTPDYFVVAAVLVDWLNDEAMAA